MARRREQSDMVALGDVVGAPPRRPGFRATTPQAQISELADATDVVEAWRLLAAMAHPTIVTPALSGLHRLAQRTVAAFDREIWLAAQGRDDAHHQTSEDLA